MKETVYRGRILDVEHEEMQINGKPKVVERAIVPDSAVVVPFLDKETVLMEKSFRPVINKYLYEFPAGKIDKDESAAAAAGRELEEELGYEAGRIEPLFKGYSSPGRITEEKHFFKATDLKKTDRHPEEFEVIEPVPIKVNELLRMIRRGDIEDMHTIAAILYCETFRS